MFPSVICDEGTILVSGGLGGLGLTMSRWMIEKHGVKRLVLMSRRTCAQFEHHDNNLQLEDWLQLQRIAAEYGAHIDVVQVDVTRFDDVYQVMRHLSQTPYPVRGIIHSAVVSEDKLLANLNGKVLARVLGPQVCGGWNLHRAAQSIGIPLHFFVMFSSIRNHMIDLGSASYNAGNEFLDALAHYRSQHLQQSALSISLPIVSGAGMFHRQRDNLMSLYSSQGFETLPTLATFELVERLFAKQASCPCPIIFAVNWQTLSTNKSGLPTYQLAQLVEKQIDAVTNSLVAGRSAKLESDISIETITQQTQLTVMRLLGSLSIDRIDINCSLMSQGIDSLAAISLYNWVTDKWNVHIPLANIFQGISVRMIANQVYDKLKERLAIRSEPDTIFLNNITSMATTTPVTRELSVNHVSSYMTTEKVAKIFLGTTGQPTVFCICTESTTASFHKRLQQFADTYTIHVLKIPTNLSTKVQHAHETITQMRRLQPRGPYLIYAADSEAKLVTQEIFKQLEQYTEVGASHLLADEFFHQFSS